MSCRRVLFRGGVSACGANTQEKQTKTRTDGKSQSFRGTEKGSSRKLRSTGGSFEGKNSRKDIGRQNIGSVHIETELIFGGKEKKVSGDTESS